VNAETGAGPTTINEPQGLRHHAPARSWKSVIRTLAYFIRCYLIVGIGFAIAFGVMAALLGRTTHHTSAPSLLRHALLVGASSGTLFLALFFSVGRASRGLSFSVFIRHVWPQPRRVLYGAALWFVAHLASFAVFVAISVAMDPHWARDLARDFVWPPQREITLAWVLLLVLFPFQSAIEELVFRGWLTRTLAQVIQRRGCVALLVGVAFSMAHGIDGYWRFADYVVISLGLSALVRLTGRLDEAMGAHAMNNVWVATTGVLFGGQDDPASFFTAGGSITWLTFLASVVLSATLYLIARWRMRRAAPGVIS
jgi:membrane protease YdiL (CAAX protease family)